jgi:flavin-binding protein dodecin
MMKTQPEKENHMERTYKKIEIVGSSETSFGEATQRRPVNDYAM